MRSIIDKYKREKYEPHTRKIYKEVRYIQSVPEHLVTLLKNSIIKDKNNTPRLYANALLTVMCKSERRNIYECASIFAYKRSKAMT